MSMCATGAIMAGVEERQGPRQRCGDPESGWHTGAKERCIMSMRRSSGHTTVCLSCTATLFTTVVVMVVVVVVVAGMKVGDYKLLEKAEDSLKESLEIREAVLSRSDPGLGQVLTTLGDFYLEQG